MVVVNVYKVTDNDRPVYSLIRPNNDLDYKDYVLPDGYTSITNNAGHTLIQRLSDKRIMDLLSVQDVPVITDGIISLQLRPATVNDYIV